MELPSLIAFGALAPFPSPDRLNQLRIALRHHTSLKSITKAIQELPLLWKILLGSDPSLQSISGEAASSQLSQWISGAGTAQFVEAKGNTTRMPLTIISQIVQYISYLHQPDAPLSQEAVRKSVALGGGIQGFCVGLLSALAVASGKTENDIGDFAAISVKLAFCIGVYVDLDEFTNGGEYKASAVAVRWKAPTKLEDIQLLLSRYQDVSVIINFH